MRFAVRRRGCPLFFVSAQTITRGREWISLGLFRRFPAWLCVRDKCHRKCPPLSQREGESRTLRDHHLTAISSLYPHHHHIIPAIHIRDHSERAHNRASALRSHSSALPSPLSRYAISHTFTTACQSLMPPHEITTACVCGVSSSAYQPYLTFPSFSCLLCAPLSLCSSLVFSSLPPLPSPSPLLPLLSHLPPPFPPPSLSLCVDVVQ